MREYIYAVMKILHEKFGKICKVIYVLGLICFAAFISSNTFLKNSVKIDGSPDINGGHFGEVPTWFLDSLSKEASLLYAEYETTDYSTDYELAYYLYELSLKKLALTKFYATKLHGIIDFSSVGIEGRSETIQSTAYYKKNTPTLSANDDFESYYQNIIYLSKEPALLNLSSVNQGIREYCDGTTVYEEHGKNPVVDNDTETATWTGDLKTYPLTEHDTYREYADGELREKSNYVINLDTIDDTTVEIFRKTDDSGLTYYEISFEIKIADGDQSAIQYEKTSIERTMGGKLKLECKRAKISMTIYDNGYMTKWATESDWISYFGRITGDAYYKSQESISYFNEEEKYFKEWRERVA